MSSAIRLTILGEPASKANSRQLVTIRGRPAFIKSKKARDYEAAARPQVAAACRIMFTGLVRVTMRLFYASRRPDLDPSVVLDVMQGHAYENDRQVREMHLYWSLDKANPRAEVLIEPIAGGEPK